MISTASGRLALILTAGFFVSFAEPSSVAAAPAAASSKSETATSDKSVRQSSRHTRRHARKSGKSDAKDSETRKTGDSAASAVLPVAVADANARLTGDASVDVTGAASASAGTMFAAADTPADSQPASEAGMVASDELNELDRAVPQNQNEAQSQPAPQQAQTVQPQAQTVAVAMPKAAPVLASTESSSLDNTSLIGKIFIAVGTLLTMVSAARMFMA